MVIFLILRVSCLILQLNIAILKWFFQKIRIYSSLILRVICFTQTITQKSLFLILELSLFNFKGSFCQILKIRFSSLKSAHFWYSLFSLWRYKSLNLLSYHFQSIYINLIFHNNSINVRTECGQLSAYYIYVSLNAHHIIKSTSNVKFVFTDSK